MSETHRYCFEGWKLKELGFDEKFGEKHASSEVSTNRYPTNSCMIAS
jgi:hypothetical protein